MSRLLDVDDGRVRISFAYDQELVTVMRGLPERRYDAASKTWTVPVKYLLHVVRRLEGYRFEYTARFVRYREGLDEEAPEGEQESRKPAVPEGTWTVSALNHAAQQALRERFEGAVWIVGELQDFDKSKRSAYRHLFFDLVERPVEGAAEVARISAVIFEVARGEIEGLARAHKLELRDGVSVRLRCRVELYARSGRYQIVVDGIDPAYTLGELELNRDRVFEALKKKGIEELNRGLSWPLCPLRVGLITSHGSDAYNDFIHQLKESGRAFSVVVHHTNVQGVHTEESVLRALRYFEERADEFDLVAIVRGGGSRSDLAYFDTEAIGEAVCRFPLKVICGVGHQQDICLLDLIAESAKTPTAAAEQIVGQVDRFVEQIEGLYKEIGHLGELRLSEAKQNLIRHGARLERVVQRRLGAAWRAQDQVESALIQATRERIAQGRRAEVASRERLALASRLSMREKRGKLAMARQELSLRRFEREFFYWRSDLERYVQGLAQGALRVSERERLRVEQMGERLGLLDPRRVLERGYALIRSEEGVISSREGLRVGETFDIVFADGTLRARRLDEEPRAEDGRGESGRAKKVIEEQ